MLANRIDWPWEIWFVTPERIESMPSVTRKEGTRSIVTKSPLAKPTNAPAATPTSPPPNAPSVSTVSAVRMPVSVTSAPTERSIDPIRITTVSASDTSSSTDD